MSPRKKCDLESKQNRLRRKYFINTFAIPIELISPPTNRPSRSVYIVARPITKAGYFKFLSEGKLPLCHWGLLVSRCNEVELRRHIISLLESSCCTAKASWGTLYEIINGHGMMVLNTNENFGVNFDHDWRLSRKSGKLVYQTAR